MKSIGEYYHKYNTDDKKMIINIRVYQYINLYNMAKYCCNCSRITNIKEYYTKFIQDVNIVDLYCDTCFDEKQKYDDMQIENSIKFKLDVKSLVRPEFLANYVIPLKIHKEISEVINGINTEFVVIEKEAYNDYMKKVAYSSDRLVNDKYISKIITKQQKEIGVELGIVNGIEERERREKEREEERERKKVKQIDIDRFNNEKAKREKQEFLEERKKDLDEPGAKAEECKFCNTWRVFPKDFKDDNNKTFTKKYVKDKEKLESKCCVNCYCEANDKKNNYIDECKRNKITCRYCKTKYIMICKRDKDNHESSTKCLRAKDYNEDKKDLSLMTVNELRLICKKSLNDDGTYRISNYTKMKKDDLLEKMVDIYELLVFI
jgi:hypothetical protein